MPQFEQNKPNTTVIVAKIAKKLKEGAQQENMKTEEGMHEDSSIMLKGFGQEMIDAIKSDDVESFAQALKNFVEYCFEEEDSDEEMDE